MLLDGKYLPNILFHISGVEFCSTKWNTFVNGKWMNEWLNEYGFIIGNLFSDLFLHWPNIKKNSPQWILEWISFDRISFEFSMKIIRFVQWISTPSPKTNDRLKYTRVLRTCIKPLVYLKKKKTIDMCYNACIARFQIAELERIICYIATFTNT